MKIYLASYFNTRARLLPIRDAIAVMGHRVVSTWLDEGPEPNEGKNVLPEEERYGLYALRDYQEIKDCDLLIADTFDVTERGGREVELGYALGKMKQVWVVGPRRNVFHFTVRHFETWENALKELSTMVGSYASIYSHPDP